MVAMDDSSRVRQCRDGDHDAFADLIREHQRMIHSLCYRMTGSLAEAEDLAQQTFIRAFEHLDGFRAEARFSSWLYRIAMNLCLNWQQHRARQERLYHEWSEQARGESGADTARAQQVQEALLKLNPKQRAAVILTVYDGLNHAEAAQVLGCSETTVSWRVFTARKKLKALLKNMQPRESRAASTPRGTGL
jgi:RNA polymerase sigma-70 factor (ECF subfamily)